MINDNTSSNKIKENKYKILRMSLLLGNGEDRSETINNFEEASREIDSMNDEIYLKNLEKKFYDTLTLEEEEKKLAELVDYIGGRVEQRLSLLNDFSNITGYELSHLPPIKYYDRLEEYKERLSYIREYLDNTNKINELKIETSELENKLNKSYLEKANSEEQNIREEKELLKRFNFITNNILSFKNITLDNVNEKLSDVTKEVEDSKKSLDIFNNSYTTLSTAGISEEEKREYQSYVESAKEVYYSNKEKEYLLKLFIIFNTTESDYKNILSKRNNINEIISERLNLRKELNINNLDKLSSIYDTIDKQYEEINAQQETINNIETYSKSIEDNKKEIEQLENDNKKPEILSLLKEFCIIDSYDEPESTEQNISINEIESKIASEVQEKEPETNTISNDENFEFSFPQETSIQEPEATPEKTEMDSIEEPKNVEFKEEETIEEEHEDNEVISINDATKIDINAAITKSNTVMQRVGEMLGVKIEVTPITEQALKEETTTETPEPTPEENKEPELTEENIFTTTYDADPEISLENNVTEQPQIEENPLFTNALANSTLDEVMANNQIEDNNNNDDFWISNEDSPLDLNSLPDLQTQDTTDNPNGELEELKFPDLDFTNMEVK